MRPSPFKLTEKLSPPSILIEKDCSEPSESEMAKSDTAKTISLSSAIEPGPLYLVSEGASLTFKTVIETLNCADVLPSEIE